MLVTTHDEKIVNSLRRRVLTLKDGKLIGDQKDRGQYDLDATRTRIVKHPLNPNSPVRRPAPVRPSARTAAPRRSPSRSANTFSRTTKAATPVKTTRRNANSTGKK